MNSGIWIRVGDKNVLLENMNSTDRREWILNLKPDALLRLINHLCFTIKQCNRKGE